MTVINYYDNLSSYNDSKDKAKVFFIQVDVKKGTTICSSPLPIHSLEIVIAAIEAADAARTALPIWDRCGDTLMYIPHDNIVSVSLRVGSTAVVPLS